MSKHKTIPAKIRKEVYEKYNHHCAYCGCELEYKDMQVDHVKSVYIHNDISKNMSEEEMYDISDLLPACRQCNFYKNTMSIEDFRKRLENTMMENLKKNFSYRLALKYRLIEEKKSNVTFYFEKDHEYE